jgi:iron complex transport system ATP-binding protein
MGYPKEQKKFRIILMEKSISEILSFESLEIGYPSGRSSGTILPPLNAKADSGELIAIIGRNGVGKSTLLRTLVGLLPPFRGKVKIKGIEIGLISRLELAKIIGYISTEIVRVSNMSVFDLVSLGRFPHTNWIGKIDREGRLAVEDALNKTGLAEFGGKYINELSDGERQRAMIARVLAQDTEIMLMDEPTAFLDIAGKYDIVNLLKKLTGERKTIIFSTHDLNIALNMADKIWLMFNDGLLEGSPDELVRSNSFTHLFGSSEIKFDPATGKIDWKAGSQDHLKYFL